MRWDKSLVDFARLTGHCIVSFEVAAMCCDRFTGCDRGVSILTIMYPTQSRRIVLYVR